MPHGGFWKKKKEKKEKKPSPVGKKGSFCLMKGCSWKNVACPPQKRKKRDRALLEGRDMKGGKEPISAGQSKKRTKNRKEIPSRQGRQESVPLSRGKEQIGRKRRLPWYREGGDTHSPQVGLKERRPSSKGGREGVTSLLSLLKGEGCLPVLKKSRKRQRQEKRGRRKIFAGV